MATRPRHALITGGSRGIGLSIAQLFAKKGFRCTLISRSEEDLKAAIYSLQPLPAPKSSNLSPSSSNSPSSPQDSTTSTPPSPYQHAYIPGSISLSSHFWTTHPSSAFGSALPKPTTSSSSISPSSIDILVNCAGIAQSTLFMKTPGDQFDKIVQTNLTAMMFGTKFLMRQGYLRGSRRGREGMNQGEEEEFSPVIINVASLLGIKGGYGAVAYAASKAGVLGFTRALATEYAGHGVRVNAIVPGYIETDMTKDMDASQLHQRIPLGRFGKPEEIAQAALFLAENQYAHNCVINLDGGLSAV